MAKVTRLAAAALASMSMAAATLGGASAQSNVSARTIAGRIDSSMLVVDRDPRASYRMAPFRSYGRVRVDVENAAISTDCESSPVTSFLRRLLVQRNRSAGIALRLTTSNLGATAGDTSNAGFGTFADPASDRIVLFAGNLLRVSRNEGLGSRCRAQLDTGGVYTPLLDLRGQPRAVRVEFLVWTSREHSPGFIPSTAIDLYSTKALAPLTRDQVSNVANALIGMFDNATEGLTARTLNFETTPEEYGVSLVFDPNDRIAQGARVNIELQTTSSMFWAGSVGDADFQNISPSDVLAIPVGPRMTVQSAIESIAPAEYAKWTGVRATDTDFSDFEAGCASIERRVGEIGLTGEDQVIARWAVVAQHGAIRTAGQRFANTVCLSNLRTALARMGPRQPTAFAIPEEVRAPPRYPSAAEMDRFMRTRFRPYTRTPADEDRQLLTPTVFTPDVNIFVSSQVPTTTPALVGEGGLTGDLRRISCFTYTLYREDLGVPGSRVEGIAELGGGVETNFRAYFGQAAADAEPRIMKLEFHSEAPSLALDRIRDQHGDQCDNGWRPRLVFGPR